ncbi:MAG: sensor histidine kinase [Flavobacteriaceae bacterium]|nr:sensor histidine kinase [Flavobacteriaceae bacterium]
MKQFLHIFSLLFFLSVNAQDSDLQTLINQLETKIQSEDDDAKKLFLLDSLTSVVRDKSNFAYDSIARTTIDLAIKIDSFNLAAYNTTNLINYYNNILGKPKTGIAIFNTYFWTLKHHISDRNLASLYIDSGDSFYFTKQVDSAMQHYDKAISYAEKAKDNRVKGFAILYKGYTYSDEGKFALASETLKQASEIFITEKDTFNVIAAKNALALLYSANGFLKEARQERKETIYLAKITKSYGQLISLYVNQANDLKKQGLENKRIESLHKAMLANKKSNYFNYFNPILLSALTVAYAENDSLEKAKHYLKKIENNEEQTKGIHETEYFKALKKIAFAEKNYFKAKDLGIKHLEVVSKSNDIKAKKEAQEFLSNVYENLNLPSQAFLFYKAAKKIEDSIQSVQKTKALAYYQTLYETAKRDQKIKEQNGKIILLDEQNKRKKQTLWFGGLALIALFSIAFLWRSRRFSQKKAQLQKDFAQDLIKNVETERKRISSELHDSIGHSLLLIKNKVLLSDQPNQGTKLIDDTIDEVRHISQNLHPFQFEKLGLLASIKTTIKNFQKNSKIFYSEDIDIESLNLAKDKEIFVFRMIQECLNNVEKHSKAKACNVMINNKKDYVLFQIKDNGIGFDISENSKTLNSLGIKTLKERAQIIGAQLSINSTKGKGTIIQIKVPKY